MTIVLADLPLRSKQTLVRLAARLPPATRSEFLRNTLQRLEQVALSHPKTLTYGALGWILGEFVDHILTIHVPFTQGLTCLTGDKASQVGLLIGALNGFLEDRAANQQHAVVARIVCEEVQRALGAARAL
jgi:hypothetical protein